MTKRIQKTKEELEFEIGVLANNIDVLDVMGHDTNKPRLRLADLTSKLLSLICNGGNGVPAEYASPDFQPRQLFRIPLNTELLKYAATTPSYRPPQFLLPLPPHAQTAPPQSTFKSI